MIILGIIYLLLVFIFVLIAYAIMQLKFMGLNVKDFWSFIEANQMLDKLYRFSKQYERMSTQEQIIYLMEAEKIFNAFEKVPNQMWEEDYQKYEEVLDVYKNIKLNRWQAEMSA